MFDSVQNVPSDIATKYELKPLNIKPIENVIFIVLQYKLKYKIKI